MARREFSKQVKRQALARSGGKCEAEGCCAPIFRRTFCVKHYTRLIRHGDISDSILTRVPCGAPMEWLEQHKTHRSEECLPFPFDRYSTGYGRASYMGKRLGAHRIMCILVYGEPPTEKHEAAHSCGKGHEGCVNPSHLRWATSTENKADRLFHGTDNRGSRHGNAKLSESDILAIRRGVTSGMTRTEAAAMFGITAETVGKIVRGERWGWVQDA